MESTEPRPRRSFNIPIATAGSTIDARANRRHVLPKRKATKIIAGSTIETRANRRHMLPTTQDGLPNASSKKYKATNSECLVSTAGSTTDPRHVLPTTQDGHPIQIHRRPPTTFQRTRKIPRSFHPLHTQRGQVSTDPSICVETDRSTGSVSTTECVPDLAAESTEARPMKSPDDRTVVTIKYRRLCDENEKSRHKWTRSKVLHRVPKNATSSQPTFTYNLRRGGTLKVHPNLISPERLASIEKEVLNCGFFRQYRVQAQDEPRVHFLLHEEATENFEEKQPGYRYSKVCAKARPLSRLPLLETLSKELAKFSNVESWNIGVNPVLYRGSRDSMGEHADDDQGEDVVLCLIVSSPRRARRVRITPKARGEDGENDDENIELVLSEGDAYEMDGKMQENYFHSVPKTKDDRSDDSDKKRLCIVFRTGDDFSQLLDSGRKCEDLAPKEVPQQIFGNGILGLREGHVYTRGELFDMGAHRMQQRGVSGKIETGCDAIIVSGLREDKLGCDSFLQFDYAVEQKKGAKSVLTSLDNSLPIRVFRSSLYNSPFKATSMDTYSSTIYRYDGLYGVVGKSDPVTPGQPFVFQLQRLDNVGNDDEAKNLVSNRDALTKYAELGTIQIQDGYAITNLFEPKSRSVEPTIFYYQMEPIVVPEPNSVLFWVQTFFGNARHAFLQLPANPPMGKQFTDMPEKKMKSRREKRRRPKLSKRSGRRNVKKKMRYVQKNRGANGKKKRNVIKGRKRTKKKTD